MAKDVEAPEETLVEEGSKGRRGTRARVTLEGDVPPSTLRRVIPGESKPEDKPEPARGKVLFAKAIRNTDYRIIAKRIAPPVTADGRALGDDYELTPHDEYTEADIRSDLQENRGGTKWVVRVIDENGATVASKPFVVGGEPKRDPMWEAIDPPRQPHGDSDLLREPPTPTGEELDAQIDAEIESDPEVKDARKRARLEELEIAKLRRDGERAKIEAEMRRMRDDGSPRGGDDAIRKTIEQATQPLREANERLQRELDEKRRADEHERNMEARLAPMKAALDAATAKLNAPPQQGPTVQEILAKMESMAASIKADTTAQIANAIEKMTLRFEGQIGNINTQLSSIANRPQDGGALATAAVNALSKIATDKEGPKHSDPIETTAKVIGLVRDAQELTGTGPGQAVVPPDFPSFLVDRVTNLAPQVFDYLEKKQGAPIGREELQEMFKQYGMKMYSELDKTIKAEMRGGLQRVSARGLPTPTAPGPQPQSTVPQTIFPTPAPQIVAPEPTTVPIVQFGETKPPKTVSIPVSALSDESIEVETRQRVNWVLAGLLREMKMGVQEMLWPEKAYGNLPKGILEKIIEAKSDADIYDAIRPWAEPSTLESIHSYIADSHPQHQFYREWLTAGVNWIKEEAAGPESEPETETEPKTQAQ